MSTHIRINSDLQPDVAEGNIEFLELVRIRRGEGIGFYIALHHVYTSSTPFTQNLECMSRWSHSQILEGPIHMDKTRTMVATMSGHPGWLKRGASTAIRRSRGGTRLIEATMFTSTGMGLPMTPSVRRPPSRGPSLF